LPINHHLLHLVGLAFICLSKMHGHLNIKFSGYPVSTRDSNPSALGYENTTAFSTDYHAMERAKWKVSTRCAYKSFIGKPDEELCGREDNSKKNVTLFHHSVKSLGA